MTSIVVSWLAVIGLAFAGCTEEEGSSGDDAAAGIGDALTGGAAGDGGTGGDHHDGVNGEAPDSEVQGPDASAEEVAERCSPADPINGVCCASAVCQSAGMCATGGGRDGTECRAESDADCQASDGCRDSGRCVVALDGRGSCEMSDEGCRATESCTASGRCGAGPGEYCGLAADSETAMADCRASDGCRDEGLCTAGCYNVIFAPIGGRINDRECGRDYTPTRCGAHGDADCLASRACHRENLCMASGRGDCIDDDVFRCRPECFSACMRRDGDPEVCDAFCEEECPG